MASSIQPMPDPYREADKARAERARSDVHTSRVYDDRTIWTGTLPDGRQILVNVWDLPSGQIVDVAFRTEEWEVWDPPTRLQREGKS